MYMVGLSGTVCMLSIKELPEWLLDQTHPHSSWVQGAVDLPIVQQSGACRALLSLGWAVAQQWQEHCTFLQAWSLTLFSLLSKRVHEILSQNCVVFPKAFLSRNCPIGKPRECCRSSGPAVTLCLATGTQVLKCTLQFQVCVVCRLVRDSAHFNISFGRRKWRGKNPDTKVQMLFLGSFLSQRVRTSHSSLHPPV